jgi:hypothetical protein
VGRTINGEEAYNSSVFTTTMSIYKANATVIISIDIPSIGERVPYPVNISEFFMAFTAPLEYVPVNVTRLLQSDYLPTDAMVNTFDLIFLNSTNQSVVADQFVDSLLYSFTSPLPSQSPPHHLHGFLANALSSNSGLFYGEIERGTARLTYRLKINEGSLGIYAALNGSVVLACLYMMLRYRLGFSPDTSVFNELKLAGKLGSDMLVLLQNHGTLKRKQWSRPFRM